MAIKYVADWREMYDRTIAALTDPRPLFYGRIGGSDTDMIVDYLEGVLARDTELALLDRVRPHYRRIEEYNGYYDKDQNERNLIRFCEELLNSYKALTYASLVGGKWLTLYFKENLNPKFWVDVGEKAAAYDYLLQLISEGHEQCFLFPFPFIEKTTSHEWSLFNAFREILKGKNVLVISPFSKTIQDNFRNRTHFFRNYEYPDFNLVTYTTPITYKGLPDNLYPHRNWFATVESMKGEIDNIDFDIALLSCGSYAMPVGDFIARRMKKKALYVGGVLQLYFGIMGRRYVNPFFLNQINQEYFVRAEERELYLRHISISADSATEGFGAYL
jgi:hypothetical protein